MLVQGQHQMHATPELEELITQRETLGEESSRNLVEIEHARNEQSELQIEMLDPETQVERYIQRETESAKALREEVTEMTQQRDSIYDEW
eukprot:497782-Amphidinium_carterae.1